MVTFCIGFDYFEVIFSNLSTVFPHQRNICPWQPEDATCIGVKMSYIRLTPCEHYAVLGKHCWKVKLDVGKTAL